MESWTRSYIRERTNSGICSSERVTRRSAASLTRIVLHGTGLPHKTQLPPPALPRGTRQADAY